MADDGEWITAAKAARYLGITERTLRSEVGKGLIAVEQDGMRLRFRQADLDAYIEASVVEPGTLAHLHPDSKPAGR
jgi:excisionase family DNA binding protein